MDAMSKRLEKSMQDQKYVKTKTKFNPWSREDERKYNELWIELGDNIDNYKHLPMAEAYKRVDELVARKIKGIITSDPDREEETMKKKRAQNEKLRSPTPTRQSSLLLLNKVAYPNHRTWLSAWLKWKRKISSMD